MLATLDRLQTGRQHAGDLHQRQRPGAWTTATGTRRSRSWATTSRPGRCAAASTASSRAARGAVHRPLAGPREAGRVGRAGLPGGSVASLAALTGQRSPTTRPRQPRPARPARAGRRAAIISSSRRAHYRWFGTLEVHRAGQGSKELKTRTRIRRPAWTPGAALRPPDGPGESKRRRRAPRPGAPALGRAGADSRSRPLAALIHNQADRGAGAPGAGRRRPRRRAARRGPHPDRLALDQGAPAPGARPPCLARDTGRGVAGGDAAQFPPGRRARPGRGPRRSSRVSPT